MHRVESTAFGEIARDVQLRVESVPALGQPGDEPVEAIDARGAIAVIPAKANRKVKRDTDWSLYKERHKIEVMFGFMKHYRRVFARFDKLARRFLAFVHFVAACILLR